MHKIFEIKELINIITSKLIKINDIINFYLCLEDGIIYTELSKDFLTKYLKVISKEMEKLKRTSNYYFDK
jgi:hypothetical protein